MRRLRTLVLGAVAALAGLLVLAGPAAAHVTVSAPGAARGGSDQTITFRVPTEKEIPTTGFTLALPTDTPIASVDVAPMPGWTHRETSTKLAKPITTDDGQIASAVTQITWTAAAGAGIKPGEYGTFTILAGALPDADQIAFKAVQTYADRSTVRWVETAAPGSTDQPEHPAPVLSLTAATAPTAAKASTTAPTVLSIIALIVAAAALGLAVLARARRTAAA